MRNPFARRLAAVALLATGVGACSTTEDSQPAAQDGANPSGLSQARGVPMPGGAPPSQSPRDAAVPAPQKADQGHVYRMKMIKAVDEHGFERPIVAKSMLVPTDWQSQGSVTWNTNDRCNLTQIRLSASGPDGRGLEMYPPYSWLWSDNPALLRQALAMQAGFGSRPCDVQPPMTAADYIRRMLSQVRPNAQLIVIEPAPMIMEVLQQQAREREQAAAKYNLKLTVRPDAARARLKYDLNGQPTEEWLYANTITTAKPGLGMDPYTGQLVQQYSYDCVGYMTTHRAPLGQLDASEKFFELVFSTSRLNPEWLARFTQLLLKLQQIELKGIRDRSNIISRSANEIADMQMQSWQNRQRSEDRVADSYTQSLRGVETYRNPATGDTIELSNEYGSAWVNNRGEYLLSDSPNFDPSVALKEEWKPLERVRR